MPISVGDSGAWKLVTAMWVGSGGAWKKVTSFKVGSGGAWKESFVIVTLSGATIQDNGSSAITNAASAGLRVDTDGNTYGTRANDGTSQLNPSTDWIRPVVNPTTYFVRATLQSGSTPDTGTLNTWLALTSPRSWTVNQNGAGTTSSELLIEIATDSGGSNVVASNTYDMTATVI